MRERSAERPLTVKCEDAAQLSAALPGWRIDAIPLFRKSEAQGCIRVTSPEESLTMLHVGRGTLLRGTSPRSHIAMLLNDPASPSARILSRSLKTGVGVMLGPLGQLDVFLPANCAMLIVSGSISGSDLTAAPGPGTREFCSIPQDLHLQAIETSWRLIQRGEELIRAARARGRSHRLFEQLAREAVGLPNPSSSQPVRHVAVVRACNHIDAHLGESISLGQLCDAAGARPRTLEYGFREFFDVGPMTYLRCMRLYRTRRELLNAKASNVSVTATARRWRFSHMGQFSRDYRLLFGEKPSTTLARALSIGETATT